MVDQARNVVAALAKRRDNNRNDVQPEVQILAELTAIDRFLEVLVGGGNHPHIHFDGSRRPEPLDFLFLQDAQDLGLGLLAHVADFVEEDRSAIGLLELCRPASRWRR